MHQGRFRVLCLWLADVICIASAWTVVVLCYKAAGFGQYDAWNYLRAWPIVFVFTGINFIAKLYHGRATYPSMPLPQVEEFRRLALSALSTHLLVMSLLGFSRDAEMISRFVLIVAGVLTAATASLFRDVIRGWLKRTGIGQIPAIIVGDGRAAALLERRFASDTYNGFCIVRSFADADPDEVLSVARELDVKHLFCCYKDERYFRVNLGAFLDRFRFIEYIPVGKEFPIADARLIQIGGIGGVEMVNQRQMKLLTLEKSIVDRLLSMMIFLAALPFFVIVPLLIKLTCRGPVFYKAKRLGKKGRTIYVWKFRSMYVDADKRLDALLASDQALKAEFEKDFKLKNDPRVTPLGKFLRKTSIDELPQLFNVFRGEMALVGPRPIVEKEISYYGKSYELFSSVKPGITGLWQASGRSDCDYDERVALDVHYILNWTPWMDIWIVFRTIVAVLKMKGSY